ncbi:hypothetical protein FJTKL_04594, partial [Diaporthe vaccinii]
NLGNFCPPIPHPPTLLCALIWPCSLSHFNTSILAFIRPLTKQTPFAAYLSVEHLTLNASTPSR